MKYPNLLVITSVDFINEVGPTENTLRSFLSSWNQKNIRLLICKDFNADYSHDGSQIYTLGHKEIFIASCFLNGNRNAKSSLGFPTHVSGLKSSGGILKRYKNCIRAHLKEVYQLLPYRFDQNLKKWLDDFKPEVIYFCGSNYRNFWICKEIVKRYDIPVIPHFLDDWPNIRISLGNKDTFYKKRFRVLFDFIMSKASFGLCISDLMAQHYSERYSKEFYALMNSVPDEYSKLPKVPYKVRTFLYAGSLYLKRDESLLHICEILAENSIENIEFRIFAPEVQWAELKSKFAKFTFVHYGGFLTADQLKAEISKTDVIVFTESFDETVLEFSRLSLSTRVPEFLSSGKPILAVGPSVQGAIQYLEKNNAAYVITEKSNSHQVLQEMQNHELMQEKLDNARRLFLSNHTTKSQQAKFYTWVLKAKNRKLNKDA